MVSKIALRLESQQGDSNAFVQFWLWKRFCRGTVNWASVIPVISTFNGQTDVKKMGKEGRVSSVLLSRLIKKNAFNANFAFQTEFPISQFRQPADTDVFRWREATARNSSVSASYSSARVAKKNHNKSKVISKTYLGTSLIACLTPFIKRAQEFAQ